MNENWIVNHLAARAHYEMPKALHSEGRLKYLLTDFWAAKRFRGKGGPLNVLRKLLQRGNSAIPDSKVKSFNSATIAFELKAKFMRKSDWDLILMRNYWYQEKVTNLLPGLGISHSDVFFSFAYTALEPFKALNSKVKTVLYQMDPGFLEEKIVREENRKARISNTGWKPAPSIYWKNWKSECEFSDKIIVNSDWSKRALLSEGISGGKISVIPLPFTVSKDAEVFERVYPQKFSNSRPLKVLFLGTLTVRKGFHLVLEAADALRSEPVIFYLVGQKEFDFAERKNLKFFGHVSREETVDFYKGCDVFLFPTLSDGFGLTQVEALSWKLPVVCSRNCAEVIEDQISGEVLKDNTVDEIIHKIQTFIKCPEKLLQYSGAALARAKYFNHQQFITSLIKLESGIKK